MEQARMKEIIQNLYGDLKLAVPDEELRETIRDLKINRQEIAELGIESAMKFIEPCDGCKRDNTDYCYYCIHGYYGSGKIEIIGGRMLTDCSKY